MESKQSKAQPLVSVVMPAYNAEKFIGQAFESLITQTMSEWECVVVNDGSTDNTLNIIEQYANREPRIRFYSIENSGSAKTPRDLAVSKANSEWIIVLDADDWMAEDVLQNMTNRQAQTGADIVLLKMVGFDKENPNNDFTIPAEGFDYSQLMDGKEAVMQTIGGWKIGANGGLFRKSIWTSRKTYIDKNVKHMNADDFGTREMFIRATLIAFVDVNYFYRLHGESITNKVTSKIFETLITNKMLVELLSLYFEDDSVQIRRARTEYYHNIISKYIHLALLRSRMSEEEIKKAKDIITNHYRGVTLKSVIKTDLSCKFKILYLLPGDVIYAICRVKY